MRMRETLEQLELSPEDIVLEFSERALDVDAGPFCSRIERVREEGFAIAIDDVGTGGAGTAAIERVRPDYLKVDVSIVRGIDGSLIQQDILETLATLAKRLDAIVIAEGVETEQEARAVKQGGARFAQGYFFAHPAAGRWRPGRPGET